MLDANTDDADCPLCLARELVALRQALAQLQGGREQARQIGGRLKRQGAELRELVTLFNREGYVELGAAAQTALVAVSTLEDSVDNGCPEYLEEPLEVRL